MLTISIIAALIIIALISIKLREIETALEAVLKAVETKEAVEELPPLPLEVGLNILNLYFTQHPKAQKCATILADLAGWPIETALLTMRATYGLAPEEAGKWCEDVAWFFEDVLSEEISDDDLKEMISSLFRH